MDDMRGRIVTIQNLRTDEIPPSGPDYLRKLAEKIGASPASMEHGIFIHDHDGNGYDVFELLYLFLDRIERSA